VATEYLGLGLVSAEPPGISIMDAPQADIVDLGGLTQGKDLAALLCQTFGQYPHAHMRSTHIASWEWCLQCEDGQTFLPFACVQVDLAGRQCWHDDSVYRLPLHILHLLSLFQSTPERVVTVGECNAAAASQGWRGWSRSSYRAAVHVIRRTFPNHIVAVHGVGYLFHACGRSTKRDGNGQALS
jgi:hypothetical protein